MAELQVLHVDDEPDMRLLVQMSLGLDTGISTRSAASGTEALDAASFWKPDVILLDAVMPGMDGLATLQALQANPKTAGIPVLFLTGRCSDSDIGAFRANGSAGVIAKPFDPQALATAIRGYVQATAITAADAGPTPPLGSTPDFAGRSSGPAGTGALPFGGAGLFGTTTEALLLDGNGHAFALTIADQFAGRSGGAAAPLPETWAPALLPSPAVAQAAPALTVHVTPLSPATLSSILGVDPTSLLHGDDAWATRSPQTGIEGAAFAIGHAIGCAPGGGAIDPSIPDREVAGLDALHHLGSISASTDWAAVILPRAAMH